MQHTATFHSTIVSASITKEKSESSFIKSIEEQRLIMFPALLLFLLCFSGIVASFGTQGRLAEIIMVLLPNVLTISFVIGVAPTRWVISAFAFNILMNLIVLWI